MAINYRISCAIQTYGGGGQEGVNNAGGVHEGTPDKLDPLDRIEQVEDGIDRLIKWEQDKMKNKLPVRGTCLWLLVHIYMFLILLETFWFFWLLGFGRVFES